MPAHLNLSSIQNGPDIADLTDGEEYPEDEEDVSDEEEIVSEADEEGFDDDGVADFEEPDEEDEEPETRRRGRDRDWRFYKSFSSIDEYKASDIYINEISKMSMRKSRSTRYADRETFECKFARRIAYLPCGVKFRVSFDSASDDVTIEMCGDKHSHDKDKDYAQTRNPNYFRWNEEQTELIMAAVKNELDSTVIRRNMRSSNLFNDFSPRLNSCIIK